MAKSKRMNGEGSLRQRPDGRWEYRVSDGYRKKKLSGIDMSKKYTFAQWADIWYDQHTEITATTKEGYKYTLRHLKNEFGKMQLDDIKAMHVEQFLKRLRAEGKADSGVAQCRGMLFQIFNKAEANDLIHKNPVRFAEKMRSANPMKRKEAFTGDEVKLLGLEPRHISEDGSLITIEQALVRIKGGVAIGTPKSNDSYRVIPVPPKLQSCAVKLRDTDKKFIWEAGVKDQPCNPSYFSKLYKQAITAVEGVRLLTPHSCRHTYFLLNEATPEEDEYFVDSGAGESLDMICSGFIYFKDKKSEVD